MNGGENPKTSKSNKQNIPSARKNIRNNNKNKESSADNKTNTAVALSYDKEHKMPSVVARGKGYVAERIIQEAKKADIPIYDDENVAKNLGKLDIGAFIPPEMFEVIAQIYIFVDRLENIFDEEN